MQAGQTANKTAAPEEGRMKNAQAGSLPVICRVALLMYLVHLGGCTWLYAAGSEPGARPTGELIQFFAILAAGLPWTLVILALPAIAVDLTPYASGEGFIALVHALALAAVLVNLLVLNRYCEWGRWMRRMRQPGVAS